MQSRQVSLYLKLRYDTPGTAIASVGSQSMFEIALCNVC